MAAAAMADSFGVPMEVITKVLEQFQAVEHRIEYVVEKRGVKFYNDSKGTNPDAAIQGIRAMERPTFLIGGGYDKQSEYDEWIEAFDGKVKQLVLIGQTREKIAECAKKHGFTEIAFADSLGRSHGHLLSECCRREMRFCCLRHVQAGECLTITNSVEKNSRNMQEI